MVLLSFTVLTLGGSDDTPVLGTVRSSIIDALGPVGRGFRSATKPIRSWWGGVSDYDRVEAENRKLRAEIERLRAKQSANSAAASELERLKELEGIPFIASFPTKLAMVATGPYSSFDNNTITIDRGASSGFEVGMPVVTDGGLVGKLERVTEERSVIRLITDPDFTIHLKLASSGNYALGHGNGDDRPFVVDQDVELDQNVERGELVVTSGIETSMFPMNIPIGRVTKVSTSQSDLSQVLDVELSADLKRLNAVQVVLWKPSS